MSQTVDRPRTDVAVRVDEWLSAFEDALTARDVDRAAALFAEESFWRDLVAFTWNIVTVEGPAGVADMLRATLDGVDPSGFRADGAADGGRRGRRRVDWSSRRRSGAGAGTSASSTARPGRS